VRAGCAVGGQAPAPRRSGRQGPPSAVPALLPAGRSVVDAAPGALGARHRRGHPGHDHDQKQPGC